ncbi:MAG: alpha/beta hydrolase, partial [Sphingomonadales bacterium]|nr:alpha/beta hydrolase [Sphingomonadales bacterium]
NRNIFRLALLIPVLALGVLVARKLHHRGGLDRNLAAQPMNDLTVAKDIRFGPGERQTLDVYAPAHIQGARPVMVFLYGGAWISGDKAQYAWLGAGLARQGYVAVIPNYGIYPPTKWPTFVRDNAKALAWVRSNITPFGGDRSDLILVGHSSGAFNAISLAVEPQWLAEVGMNAGRDLKAVIGLSGVYNMLPLTGPNENAIFAPPTGYTEMKNHIAVGTPPILFIAGGRDRVAEADDSKVTMAKVREKGGLAELIVYPAMEHNDSQAAFGSAPDAPAFPIRRDVAQFLSQQGVVIPTPLPARDASSTRPAAKE